MPFDAQNNVTDLTPHLERVKRQDDAAVNHRRHLIDRSSGTSFGFHGDQLTPLAPRDLIAAAEASLARETAFRTSPRGLLLLAIKQIRRHDDLAGETMMAAYSRGLSELSAKPSWDEARRILGELSRIRAEDVVLQGYACDAMRALADLMTDQPVEAA